MKVDTKKVEEILLSLQNLDRTKLPATKEGNLDIEKFNMIPEVVAVHKKLIDIGIRNNSDLFIFGFSAAGLVLRFKK